MSEQKKILEMLANGTVTVGEAEQLLSAVGAEASEPTTAKLQSEKKSAKFLRIQTNGKESVNIRVPLGFLRAGVKLAGILPGSLRSKVEKGLESNGISIDLTKTKPEDLESLFDSLADFEINVDGKDETVRISVE